MMDDLISRETAIAEVEQWAEHGHDVIHWTGIKAMLEIQPAVDAVPVVRCKDCRHYAIYQVKSDYTPDRRYNPSVCLRGEFARPHSPDWYCADGKRRDDDGKDADRLGSSR